MSISRIYELGKRSLLAYQSAINTTSGNIANVNNEHYSRRRVDLSNLTSSFSGLGIGLQDSIRLRQQFADRQIWLENQNLGKYESDEMLLAQIEDIFAEDTGAGISNVLSEFWNAWSDLANDPESEFARALVRDKGNILANTFHNAHEDLKNMQDHILPDAQAQVGLINQKLNQINDMNNLTKTQSNMDFLDERDRLLADLSKMVNIKVKEKENGEVNVYIGGLVVVSDGVVNELETNLANDGNHTKLQIRYKNSTRILNINSGELAGLIEMNNKVIPENLDKLDRLAVSIAENVNSIHRGGLNISGITNMNFFDPTVSGAADFKVNDAVDLDPTLIATRAAGEGEGSGNIALAIANLQNRKIIEGVTANNFYSTMVTNIGSTLKDTQFLLSSQELIVRQLQNRRDSITGVSLDEEMTKMMQYEQAYEAAARVVTTVDEMVQTLLAMK